MPQSSPNAKITWPCLADYELLQQSQDEQQMLGADQMPHSLCLWFLLHLQETRQPVKSKQQGATQMMQLEKPT